MLQKNKTAIILIIKRISLLQFEAIKNKIILIIRNKLQLIWLYLSDNFMSYQF